MRTWWKCEWLMMRQSQSDGKVFPALGIKSSLMSLINLLSSSSPFVASRIIAIHMRYVLDHHHGRKKNRKLYHLWLSFSSDKINVTYVCLCCGAHMFTISTSEIRIGLQFSDGENFCFLFAYIPIYAQNWAGWKKENNPLECSSSVLCADFYQWDKSRRL